MIDPHGGTLIHRIPDVAERTNWQEYALFQQKLVVDQFTLMDLELLATGAYSPLPGFMNSEQYGTVLAEQRLVSGISWALPIMLAVTAEIAKNLGEGQDLTLQDDQGRNVAVLRIEEIFKSNKAMETECLYGAADLSHPGVLRIREQGEILLAGPIVYLASRRPDEPFVDYYLSPYETRTQFQELGWNTIVAFEPRNPSLPGTNVLSKTLGNYDGIFLNPLIGSDDDDLPAGVKIRCSEILLQEYYPPDKTLLAVSPVASKGASARDVLHQAIVRKNYGATHMIVNDECINIAKETKTWAEATV
ncbi:sulfate adenylyltransferase [bacterium]|nr:sulfate adenylyltransferase [bacterium]MCI0614520.1 sulfate adenylyltransferase [bacterium]